MIKGTAIITINCPPADVFDAITSPARMGEFSPECVGGRWVLPWFTPAVGAQFEGDNVAKLGPITVKKWTTVSTVTACEPNQVFEFTSADLTHWRYEFIEIDGATRVIESFRYEPFTGFQSFIYDRLFKRHEQLIVGIEQTLARLKTVVEAECQSGSAQPDVSS